MQTVDTLIHAHWLIPIVPKGEVYEHYSLAAHQGKILQILPTTEAKKQYQADKEFNLQDHVLLPGLVNAHAHSPMVLFRGLADDLALMDWLNTYIWPAENKWVNPEFMIDGMQLAMAEMIRGGTTCFNEHYFFPDIAMDSIAKAGMRARVGLMVLEVPTPWSKDAADCFMKIEQCLAQGSPSELIQFSWAPHSPYAVSDENLLKIIDINKNLNLPIHMHVHETADEVNQSIERYGVRPLKRLANLGLLSPRLQNVHMTQALDEDIQLLKDNGCHVVHCPEGNLKLASGLCPVQRLRDNGINVALGTDGAASNNNLDLFGEIRTAALIGKVVANSPTATSAIDILEMATLGGAKAMHLDSDIGSLEAGKAADLIAVNLQHLNTQPVYHPISQLVYAAECSQVSDVWIAGKQILKNQGITTIDRESCLATAQKWAERLMP